MSGSDFFETAFMWSVHASMLGPYFFYPLIFGTLVKGSYYHDKLESTAVFITAQYLVTVLITAYF